MVFKYAIRVSRLAISSFTIQSLSVSPLLSGSTTYQFFNLSLSTGFRLNPPTGFREKPKESMLRSGLSYPVTIWLGSSSLNSLILILLGFLSDGFTS